MTDARRVAAALVLATGLTGCSAMGPDPENAVEHPVHCAYTDHDLNAFAALERRLDTRFDCAVVFSDDTPGWGDWEQPWFLRENTSGGNRDWASWATSEPGRHLVIAQSLTPRDPPENWRSRGAAGEFDQHARNLAEGLVEAGLGSSTIRLAHEPNGTWFHHYVGDTLEQRRDWGRFWARTVRTMQSVPGADFTFDLSVNAGGKVIDVEEYWPGDDVVDVIGVDQYDSYPGPVEELDAKARWRLLRDQPGGLTTLAHFARQHDKPLSIPETGLVSPSAHGAGDNPEFVRGLRSFVQSRDVRYVAYFDKNVEGTLRLDQVPKSLQEWTSFVHAGES